MKTIKILFEISILFLLLHFGTTTTVAGSDVSPKRTECGGSIASDYDVIVYPESGSGESLTRGETCVWTLHLNSTKDFNFNFQKFDLRSTSPNFDCSDIGLRIYSLENSKDSINYTYTII